MSSLNYIQMNTWQLVSMKGDLSSSHPTKDFGNHWELLTLLSQLWFLYGATLNLYSSPKYSPPPSYHQPLTPWTLPSWCVGRSPGCCCSPGGASWSCRSSCRPAPPACCSRCCSGCPCWPRCWGWSGCCPGCSSCSWLPRCPASGHPHKHIFVNTRFHKWTLKCTRIDSRTLHPQ